MHPLDRRAQDPAGRLLALLSKPTSIPLPFFLIPLDAWPSNRLGRSALGEKLPFLALAAVFTFISVISQDRIAYPAARILVLACYDLVPYLGRIIRPADLMPYYPFPHPVTLSNPVLLAGVIISALTLAAALLALMRTRAPLVGLLIFLIGLLPSVLSVGFSIGCASDKYVYLPDLGLLPPLTALLTRLWTPPGSVGSRRGRRIILVTVIIGASSLEARATRAQLARWQTSESIHGHTLKLAPGSVVIRYNFANALSDENRLVDAIEQYTLVLAADPNHARAHFNLGNALARSGRMREAAAHFRTAELDPSDAQAQNNLSNSLLALGEPEAAVEHCRHALTLDPACASAH